MKNTDLDLRRDVKKRTAQRNHIDTMSKVAIGSGFIALVTFLWWSGWVVDQLISLIEMV